MNNRQDCYAGIDIGGTKTLVLITDREGRMLQQELWATVPAEEPDAFFKELFYRLDQLLRKSGRGLSNLAGAGIGVPGVVDVKTGIITHVPALKLDGVNLKEEIGKHFEGPVYLDNDVNMAVLGEWRNGAGRGKNDLAMITVGTGIGCALLLNGQLYRGKNYAAGEISYFVVDHNPAVSGADMETADSLAFGRFESLTSGTAIGEHARMLLAQQPAGTPSSIAAEAGGIEQVRAVHVLQLAAAGDPEARHMMEAPLGYMAAGIANIVSLLNPECVIVGGGVAGSAYYMNELKQRVRRFTPIEAELLPAELGNTAGAIGAAFGIQQLLRSGAWNA